MKLSDKVDDEIAQFENMRCIGSLEACARLFAIPQSERFPSVQALTVHMSLEQVVTFAEGDERKVAANNELQKTELTEFFEFNRLQTNVKTKYCDFPQYFKWCRANRQWRKRSVNNGTMGRVYKVHPSCGERFYLRLLLHHDFCKGN